MLPSHHESAKVERAPGAAAQACVPLTGPQHMQRSQKVHAHCPASSTPEPPLRPIAQPAHTRTAALGLQARRRGEPRRACSPCAPAPPGAQPAQVSTPQMPSSVGSAEPNTRWPGTPRKLGAPGTVSASLADWQPGKWSSFSSVCAPSTPPLRLAMSSAVASCRAGPRGARRAAGERRAWPDRVRCAGGAVHAEARSATYL